MPRKKFLEKFTGRETDLKWVQKQIKGGFDGLKKFEKIYLDFTVKFIFNSIQLDGAEQREILSRYSLAIRTAGVLAIRSNFKMILVIRFKTLIESKNIEFKGNGDAALVPNS